MNALVVKPRFEASILDGTKNTSIRPPRKDGRPRATPGETLSIRVWTGRPYRSKQRELCQRVVKFVFPVVVQFAGITRPDLNGAALVRNRIAKDDGFQNWREMRAWFRDMHGLPFKGVLIHWIPDPNTTTKT